MPEEIKQLKAWFQAYELRFNEIRLSNYEYIFDLRKFIEVQVNSALIPQHYYKYNFLST